MSEITRERVEEFGARVMEYETTPRAQIPLLVGSSLRLADSAVPVAQALIAAWEREQERKRSHRPESWSCCKYVHPEGANYCFVCGKPQPKEAEHAKG